MENYEVKKIVNLPYEEIDRIQNEIDAENLHIIQQAYDDRRINAADRDCLFDLYDDGMGVYRELYRSLYEMFKQPESTCAINLETGKVDTDMNGNSIDYSLKAVTPFTCTRLEYVDKFHNPIHVIFPKMKSAQRAIEKIESEYHKNHIKEVSRILDRFFMDEDRDRFAENLRSVAPRSSQLRDILRLTITCKYFTDVERIKRLMTDDRNRANRNFSVDAAETRDLFLTPLNQNEKKYYDIKLIMHQNRPNGRPIAVEVQLKIATLYNADLRTHKIYEDARKIEADLTMHRTGMPLSEVRQKEAQVKILKNKIRRINESAVHQYNMMVLDKARRIEDDGYRPLRVQPDHPDGTYQQCRDVIANEYLVESFEPFQPEMAFSAADDLNKAAFLRLIGKIDNTFNEYDPIQRKAIQYKFSHLRPAEKERFQAITEIAHRYAKVIESKIEARARRENLSQPVHTHKSSRDK